MNPHAVLWYSTMTQVVLSAWRVTIAANGKGYKEYGRWVVWRKSWELSLLLSLVALWITSSRTSEPPSRASPVRRSPPTSDDDGSAKDPSAN